MIKNLLAKALLVAGIFASSISFAQSTYTINVGDGGNLYVPANVTCLVGDTISFVWVSGFHPTQSLNGTTIPLVNMDGSGGINSVYKIKMLTAGTVPYECTAHGGMNGIITVNAPVSNTPVITENFSYTLNDTLSAIVGAGWTPIATVSTLNKIPAVAGLTYPNSTMSNVGNAALIKNTGQDIGKAFTGTNVRSGNVYASFLMNVSAANATGDYFFAFLDSALNATNYRARAFIKSSGSGYRIGVSKSGATGVAGYTSTDLVFGTTYQIVIKYSIISGTANDSVKIFVNPTLGASEPTATAVAVTTESDITLSATVGIGAVALRQGTAANAPTLTFDGLLVGRTWASVTPFAAVNPSVKFNPTSLTVNENAGTATVTLNVTNPNSTATSVDVRVKGGTATAASDYTFTSQTVTFPANSTTAQSFTFPIIDDATQEIDETIILALRNATNSATIEADSILTITIPANDITNPVVNFVAPYSVTKAEGTQHVFSLAISSPNANATNVKVFVKSTSTASSADHSGVSASGLSITFPGGSSSNQSEGINIVDDVLAESAETVVLVLRDPTNSATIGSDSIITITIPQNDQPLVAHFIGTSANINENATKATVSVMAMGANTNGSTSFDVVVKSGTATAGSDYTFSTTTITIPGSKDSTVAIEIPINDDSIFEGDENVVFVLRNITNNGNISTDSVYTLTIKDNEVPFKNISALKLNDVNGVSVLKDSSVYIKGIVYGVDMQGSATSLQYTLIDPTGGVGIFRSGANNPPAITIVPEEGDSMIVYGKVGEFNGLTQVNMDSITLISKNNPLKAARVITSLDESTESDLVRFNNAQIIDTLANSGSGTTLRIVSGTDSMDLRIDADVNLFGQPFPQKFDIIGLGGQFDNSNPKNSGYQLLPRSINDLIAKVTPEASLDSASYTVSEGAGTKVVKVKLTAPANDPVSVKITLTGGSATFTQDYNFTNPTTVNIAVGQTEGSATFTIINDNSTENDETITFSLSDAVNCNLVNPTAGTITIFDNDPKGINFNKAISLNVYPNPANENISIVSNEIIESVSIVNIIGQTVITMNDMSSKSSNVNVSTLPAGVYNVIINTAKGSSNKRIVIE
jgi:plastocyanin